MKALFGGQLACGIDIIEVLLDTGALLPFSGYTFGARGAQNGGQFDRNFIARKWRDELNDREHLSAFLTAVDASPTALERPNCRGWMGDYQITGKHGHVLADHPGYLLYVTGTVQRWKKAKRILPGTVTQDGDDEGIVRLDRLPTPVEAESIRDLIAIRKRRAVAESALANLVAGRALLNRRLMPQDSFNRAAASVAST
jgi:hypothetical protein